MHPENKRHIKILQWQIDSCKNSKMQMELTFPTSSQINVERLTGQNLRLYNWLKTGHSINCMSSEMQNLRIGYLNSRISDLVNKYHIPIEKKYIQVKDFLGNLVTVVQYKINT